MWVREAGGKGTVSAWRQVADAEAVDPPLPLAIPTAADAGALRFLPLAWLEILLEYSEAAAESAAAAGEGGCSAESAPRRQVQAFLLFPRRHRQQETAATAAVPPEVLPLVAVPHGGPHSAFGGEFLASHAFLAASPHLALPTPAVNYSGSIGWSDAATGTLAGRVGELDVQELHAATLAALAAGGDAGALAELCELAAPLPPPPSDRSVDGGAPAQQQQQRAPPLQWLRVTVRSSCSPGGEAFFDLPGGEAVEAATPATGPLLGHLTAVHGLAFRRHRSDSETGGGVSVCGGSHGGFLAAHAVAQFPRTFAAAALRNPVINIATMAGSTDIPDWTMVEACGLEEARARLARATAAAGAAAAGSVAARSATEDSVEAPSLLQLRGHCLSPFDAYSRVYAHALASSLDAGALGRMLAASPIAHVDRAVAAPCLIVLGMRDRRVPPSQGA